MAGSQNLELLRTANVAAAALIPDACPLSQGEKTDLQRTCSKLSKKACDDARAHCQVSVQTGKCENRVSTAHKLVKEESPDWWSRHSPTAFTPALPMDEFKTKVRRGSRLGTQRGDGMLSALCGPRRDIYHRGTRSRTCRSRLGASSSTSVRISARTAPRPARGAERRRPAWLQQPNGADVSSECVCAQLTFSHMRRGVQVHGVCCVHLPAFSRGVLPQERRGAGARNRLREGTRRWRVGRDCADF